MKLAQLILISIVFLLLSNVEVIAQKDSTQFVTTWRTTNFGQGGDSTVVIPIDTNYTYNFDVDWDNDGIFDDLGVTDTIAHLYPDTGTYTIRIKGTFPRYYVRLRGPSGAIGDNKLISLDQWGTNPWLNVDRMFWNIDSFTYNAVDTPNLTFITSLDYLFHQNRNFNADVSNWDVSRIKSMTFTFAYCDSFNQPMASWDVSNVINMGALFDGCVYFNQPVNNWKVDSVQDFGGVFRGTSFNLPLTNWNTGSARAMGAMFMNSPFNQPIDNWDVSRVTYLGGMFANSAFNQPLNNWNVDSVQNMFLMFKDGVFNQPLNNWNTSRVTDMSWMFSGNKVFDQDIGNWDLPSRSFTPDPMRRMLDSTNMSVANYDSTLIKWARQNKHRHVLGAAGLSYCVSDSVRSDLINNYSWTFIGDTLNCLSVGVEEELVEQQEAFKIYPNPTQQDFTIERQGKTSEVLVIYDMQGRLIHQEQVQTRKIQVRTKGLKAGIYLVRLGVETKRVVVF